MNTTKINNAFKPYIWAFVVCFRYVSIIVNNFIELVALRIYKNIIFISKSNLLSSQQYFIGKCRNLQNVNNSSYLGAIIVFNKFVKFSYGY